jgi:hypothetical protein
MMRVLRLRHVPVLFTLVAAGVVLGAPRLVGAERFGTQVAQRWDEMSPRERGEAMRNYERYRRLPPERQRAVEENYERWQRLPPPEKDRIRGNYRRYRELSPEERRDFDRRYERWKGGR